MDYVNKIDGERDEALTTLSDAITQGLFELSDEDYVAFGQECDIQQTGPVKNLCNMSQKKCRFCD